MTKPVRLDLELVRRGLFDSRAAAKRAIEEGRVLVRGIVAPKVTTMVMPTVAIQLEGPPARFVSRGGDKLDRALDRLSVTIAGRKWLDVGASTGGFTDALLQRGAAEVAAVDVGYGQLHWRLRQDERVTVLERTNARTLTREDVPWVPDGVVADVSFISLTLLLPTLVRIADEEADYVLLVKPQFEVGRELVPRSGVIADPALWRAAIERVVARGTQLALDVVSATASDLVGPAGNREFFVHMARGRGASMDVIDAALVEAP